MADIAWNWCQTKSSHLLHRITQIPEQDRESCVKSGLTASVCGLRGWFRMPGVMSRLGAPRCKKCCRKVGIPYGVGAPFNDKSLTKEQREIPEKEPR